MYLVVEEDEEKSKIPFNDWKNLVKQMHPEINPEDINFPSIKTPQNNQVKIITLTSQETNEDKLIIDILQTKGLLASGIDSYTTHYIYEGLDYASYVLLLSGGFGSAIVEIVKDCVVIKQKDLCASVVGITILTSKAVTKKFSIVTKAIPVDTFKKLKNKIGLDKIGKYLDNIKEFLVKKTGKILKNIPLKNADNFLGHISKKNYNEKQLDIIENYITKNSDDLTLLKEIDKLKINSFEKVIKEKIDFENFESGFKKLKKIRSEFDLTNLKVPDSIADEYKSRFIKNVGYLNEKIGKITEPGLKTKFENKFNKLVKSSSEKSYKNAKGAQHEIDSFEHTDFDKIEDISHKFKINGDDGEIDKLLKDKTIIEDKFYDLNNVEVIENLNKAIKKQLPKYIEYQKSLTKTNNKIIYNIKTDLGEIPKEVMETFKKHKGESELIIRKINLKNQKLKEIKVK